jgi:histidyl-tRNA synthetase
MEDYELEIIFDYFEIIKLDKNSSVLLPFIRGLAYYTGPVWNLKY